MGPQDIVNVLVLASIYILFALGMSLVWGTLGVLNFAHGSIFMFSSFVGYLVVRSVRLPMIGLIVIGMAVGAVFSILMDVVAFQPILQRARNLAAGELQILIAGIGIASIPLAIAQRETKSIAFGFENSSFKPTVYEVAGLRITNTGMITILVTLVLSAAIVVWLRRSRLGLALRGIGVDAETASLMGIDRRRLSLGAMAFSGALAGLAGVLLTFQLSALVPESGEPFIIKAFAAIVLGGLGSISGTILGCIVLATAETLVVTHTGGQWTDAVAFAVIVLVLLVRPQGLLGKKEASRA